MSSGASMAQLALQDPASMRKFFQQSLIPKDGPRYVVATCEVDYVRQSPNRTSLQYTLGIETPNEERMSQIVTVAGFGEKRTARQWARLRQEAGNLEEGIGPLQLPRARFIPEHDLIVQVFPFDFRLPGLLRVVEGSADLVAALAGPDASKESWEAEVVRYRPDMRAMARVSLLACNAATGQQITREAYAKVYRDGEEGLHSAQVMRALDDATGAPDAAFSIAKPIAYLEPLQTLLLSAAPGVRLLDVVRRSKADEALSDVRLAARAVAGLHQLPLPDGLLPTAPYDKDQQFAEVMAGLLETYPNLAQPIREVQGMIEATLQAPLLAPTHFDLKQGHMLIDGEQVFLLDFDKLALGDPLIDVANIVATLSAEREGGKSRSERGSVLSAGFVAEYFRQVPPAWADHFPAHFARATLLEAATTGRGHRGRSGRADRSEWVHAAVEKAQQALAGSLW